MTDTQERTAVDEFTFENRSNSYFNGNDVVATRKRDGREITINNKEGYLAVNVKDHKFGYGFMHEHDVHAGNVSREVYEMAQDLNRANASRFSKYDWGPQNETELLYARAQEVFWNDAQWLAEDAGFCGVFSSGRSGGWCCIEKWTADDAEDLILHLDHCTPPDDPSFEEEYREEYEEARERRSELLNMLIDIEDLIGHCHQIWFDYIRDEHAELEREREECIVRGEN
jgi:hypothetical protein